jgi:serine/threonine protein phosphatase PrpC
MTSKLLNALLIATLMSSAAALADDNIVMSVVDGNSQAVFKVGDARCVLADDEIRCSPLNK